MIKSKKILVSGVSGQVGWELVRSCSLLGEVIALDRNEFDLSSSEKIQSAIQKYQPDILINAAAYTAVDKAEAEPELCTQINAQAVGVMAEECKKSNAVFIHFSTDYVFSGENSSPYLETDPVGPINVYGKSKLEGEKFIQSVGGDAFIYRVSWVYSHRGQNFVKTMLRLGSQRPELRIVSDQWGTPTWARFIAQGIAHTLTVPHLRDLKGLYHLVPHGDTHWNQFAENIFQLAYQKGLLETKPQVLPILTSSYPTAAQRPLNSRMSNQKFVQTFDLPLQNWERYLELCISSI